MRALLDRILFPAHLATNLAVMRLILGFCFVRFLLRRVNSYESVATKSPESFFKPVGVMAWLEAPLSPEAHALLFQLTLVLGVLFLLGVAFRYVGPLFSVLLLALVTYRQSWSFIYHTDNHLVVQALVLGFAASADRFSVDGLLRRGLLPRLRPGAAARVVDHLTGGTHDRLAPSWRYGWPAVLILLVAGVAYWVAGVAKLANSGPEWVFDAHLLEQIGNNALRYEFLQGGADPIVGELYSWPAWAFVALSAASLLLELFAPLAVLHRYLALLIAAGLFGFHWGVLWLMGIHFHYQLGAWAFVPFVRWDRLLLWVQRLTCRLRGQPAPSMPAID